MGIWQNMTGQPIVDADGKIIECGDEPCEGCVAPQECTGCGGSGANAPGQVIVTLPSIASNIATQFNHAGGDFLLDFYGTQACVRTGGQVQECATGAAIGGTTAPRIDPVNENPFFLGHSSCGYMGAIIGTHCGYDVRPFGVYCYTFSTFNTIVVGYAIADTAATPKWRPWRHLNAGNSVTSWFIDSTFPGSCNRSASCLTENFTISYAGDSTPTRIAINCDDTNNLTATASMGACTLSMRPA